MNLRLPSSFCLLLALACAPLAQAADAPAPATSAPAGAQAQAAFSQAQALYQKHAYAEAVAACEKLIAQNPTWPAPRHLRWMVLVDMGDLAVLEKELGFGESVSFTDTVDGALKRLPDALTAAPNNPRPLVEQALWCYLAAKPGLWPAGDARAQVVKQILQARDLPPDLRPKLEDLLPPLDRAEAAHLSHRYATALTRYDAIIAADPAQLRPRYLRWILLVDMGALSVLHQELGLDAELPFDASLDAAMTHLPPSLRDGKENPRPWLYQVAMRYYGIKPTRVADRGDLDLAIRLTEKALQTPGLPAALEHELRANLVIYLADANRFAETVANADALEKQYGEPALNILDRRASALESVGKHAEAISAYRHALERMRAANLAFADMLPFLRGQYTALRNGGDLKQARILLEQIRAQTAPPLPARKGCAPDWSGDYAWIELQEVRLLMQENRLHEADEKLEAMETDFAGSPEVVFLRATLEHLRGHPRTALAFYKRLEAEENPPDPRTLACRMAAQSDLGAHERAQVRAELARWQKAIPDSPEWAALALRLAQEPASSRASQKTAAAKERAAEALANADPDKIWNPDLPWAEGEVLVLNYHDIPDQVARGDAYSVDVETFVSHLELLRARGFHFIRLSDVVAARAGKAKLPVKSVLLTFDDGYKTHHDNLLPVLNLYQAPAVLAVVTHWIGHGKGVDAPDSDLCQFAPFMNAAELREAAGNPLVEIACHSDDLHHAVAMNVFGNTAPAAITRQYFKNPDGGGVYETDAMYEARLFTDLRGNAQNILNATGRMPLGIAWPFGAHNAETDAIARKAGIEVLMALGDGTYQPEDYPGMPRLLLFHTMRQSDLAREIGTHAHNSPNIRGEYLSLDSIITESDDTTSKNLDTAVAEMSRKHPSHVMLDVSDKTFGPCYPTGYPAAGNAQVKKPRDWISHIARALEVHDMTVILRLAERDRAHLDAILKMPVGEDVFLDFPATKEEVSKAQGMRTEGHVLVRIGGPANADLFVVSGPEGTRNTRVNPEDLVYWCGTEDALAHAAAHGAIHWIGSTETRFNTTRSFMNRPPADPHWLMMPPASR